MAFFKRVAKVKTTPLGITFGVVFLLVIKDFIPIQFETVLAKDSHQRKSNIFLSIQQTAV